MKWASKPRPHPGGGTWIVAMPVSPPVRDRAVRKRRPVPDCESCDQEAQIPCERHSYNPVASLGGGDW